MLFNLFGKSDYSCVFTEILSATLKRSPSLREIVKCSSMVCINADAVETSRPYLTMSFNVFNGNMDNIEKSISANLNIRLNCRLCETNFAVNVTRIFGDHLFIEVGCLFGITILNKLYF